MKPRQLAYQVALWALVFILLAAVLRQISFKDIAEVLSGLNLWQIALLLVVNSLVVITVSGRWWIILKGMNLSVPYLLLSLYRLGAFGINQLFYSRPSIWW